jgi:hypothetical protein
MTPTEIRYCEFCKEPIRRHERYREREYRVLRFCSVSHANRARVNREARREFLERWYALKGGPWCAERLGLTLDTVNDEASKERIPATFHDNYILLSDVERLSGRDMKFIITRAGKRLVHRPGRNFVPREWGEKFIAEQRAIVDRMREARQAGYLYSKEAAAILAIDTRIFSQGLSGKGTYGEYLQHLPYIADDVCRRRLFNPYDIEEAYRKIRGLRKAA